MAYNKRFFKDEIKKKIDIWFSYRTDDRLGFKSVVSFDSFLVTIDTLNNSLKHEAEEEIDTWISHISDDDYEFEFKSSHDSFLVTAYRINRFPVMED